MANTGKWRVFCVIPLLFMACLQNKVDELFKDPDTNPVRQVLKATMPVAYASNVAMSVMNGAKLSNVLFLKGGDTVVGNFLMAITVNSGFPLPEGIAADGRILVAGIIARQGVAMMSILFTELSITQGVFSIHDISTVPVILEEDVVTGKKTLFVVYSDMDVNSGSDTLTTIDMSKNQIDAEFQRFQNMKSFDGTAMIEQNTWIMKIDNNETPDDPLDDSYIESGAGQYVEATSGSAGVMQMFMVNVTMKPTCKKNPQSGWAALHNIDAGDGKTELGQLLLEAHSTCNGTMSVGAASGVYSRSWGKSVSLNLSQ